MRRIFGALLGLSVMVATAISAGDMPDKMEVQLPAPPTARATPAQIQIATKFGWNIDQETGIKHTAHTINPVPAIVTKNNAKPSVKYSGCRDFSLSETK